MRKDFPRGFIWTLPYDGLDGALLWQTCCSQGRCPEHQHNRGADSRLPIPSWCWIAKGHKIWYEPGYCSTVSRVTWHEPIAYTSDYDMGAVREDAGHALPPPVLVSYDVGKPGSGLFDFAFLHFTAQTTLLSLKPDYSDPDNASIFAVYI